MEIKLFMIFTNGNCMAFNGDGNQIYEYQRNVHKVDMDYVINNSERIEISKWGEWRHELTKREVNFLFCRK